MSGLIGQYFRENGNMRETRSCGTLAKVLVKINQIFKCLSVSQILQKYTVQSIFVDIRMFHASVSKKKANEQSRKNQNLVKGSHLKKFHPRFAQEV